MPPRWRTRRNPIYRNIFIVVLLGAAAFGVWKFVLPGLAESKDLFNAGEDAVNYLRKDSTLYRHVGKTFDPEELSNSLTEEAGVKYAHFTYAVNGERGKGRVDVKVRQDEETVWKVIEGTLLLDSGVEHDLF